MPDARSILSAIRSRRVQENEEEPLELPPEPEAEPQEPVPAPPVEAEPDLDIDPHELESDPSYILQGDSFYNFYDILRGRFGRRKRQHVYVTGGWGGWGGGAVERSSEQIEGVAEYYHAIHGQRGGTVYSSTSWLVYEDGSIALRYHVTDVITVTPESVVTLNTDGWQTKNTYLRISHNLPNQWKIAAKNQRRDREGSWFWYNRQSGVGTHASKIRIDFTDGDMLTPDGKLHPRDEPKFGMLYKKDFPVWEIR